MAREHMIRFRVNTTEAEKLDYLANRQSITVSEAIRDWIKTLPHPAHVQRTDQNTI